MAATAAAGTATAAGGSTLLMPVGFVGHGAPLLATDAGKGAALKTWGQLIPPLKAIVVVSAHWQTRGPVLGTTVARPLIYDFSGFPDELYRLTYPSPGAPEVAARVASLLGTRLPVGRQEQRGLDHGVWVPLLHMFPRATVPVLQLSLPMDATPAELVELGRTLAPLRREGVFLLGSGNITHNLRVVDWSPTPVTPAWAADFDRWAEHTLATGDLDALVNHRLRAPAFTTSHPTDEHFTPLLVAAGAAAVDGGRVSFPVSGFEFGTLSRRAVMWA